MILKQRCCKTHLFWYKLSFIGKGGININIAKKMTDFLKKKAPKRLIFADLTTATIILTFAQITQDLKCNMHQTSNLRPSDDSDLVLLQLS